MNRLRVASNPFATRFVRPGALGYRFGDDRNDFDDLRLNDLVNRLIQHRIGLLVGHHGSGKTTLLHTLLPRLEAQFEILHRVQLCCDRQQSIAVRLMEQQRIALQIRQRVAMLPPSGLLILDGAEQLGRLNFRWLSRIVRRRGLALLATSHQPISPAHVLHHTIVTPGLVRSLTEELTEGAADGVRRLVRQNLSGRSIGTTENVRDLLFDLYDVVHQQPLAGRTDARQDCA